jgi:hypothetical protein
LQSLNSDYEAKRTGSLSVKSPSIRLAPKGLFERWLKSIGKLGGQHKVPRLSNDRKLLEELIGMMEG